MNPIDEAIRQALSVEDARALERYGADPSVLQQVLEAFRGRMALLNVIGWVAGAAMAGFGLYCGWQFMGTTDIVAMLRWAAGAGLAALGIAMVKLWFWAGVQSNAVIREVKRLELQVARLAAR